LELLHLADIFPDAGGPTTSSETNPDLSENKTQKAHDLVNGTGAPGVLLTIGGLVLLLWLMGKYL